MDAVSAFWWGSLFGAGVLALVFVRPYRCLNAHCGFWTWRRRRMLHHVQNRHYGRDYSSP
jgi:hypothetical protein